MLIFHTFSKDNYAKNCRDIDRSISRQFYIGRSSQARTDGLCVPNTARYQLRHTPSPTNNIITQFSKKKRGNLQFLINSCLQINIKTCLSPYTRNKPYLLQQKRSCKTNNAAWNFYIDFLTAAR